MTTLHQWATDFGQRCGAPKKDAERLATVFEIVVGAERRLAKEDSDAANKKSREELQL